MEPISNVIPLASKPPQASTPDSDLLTQTARLLELKRKAAHRKPPVERRETRIILGTGCKYGGVKDHDFGQVDDALWERMLTCCEVSAWPMVLVGQPGTGKTCAALCLLDFAASTRIYRTVQTACEELIAAQNGTREYGGAKDSPEAWWQRWNKANCAVLDELGTRGNVSPFQYETVKRAIDEREGLPAVFVSNLHIDELAGVYDDRVASRLAGGTVIHFTGADRRLA